MATTVSLDDIQGLYIAYFNRPADYKGLLFWQSAANAAGGDINAVANAFAASTEYTTLFTGKSSLEIVDQIYVNLFGRHAELDGLNFWSDALDKKILGVGNIAYQIMKGAQNADLVAVQSKISAATQFYNSLDTAAEAIGYAGAAANAVVKTWLSGVTDATTLAAATTPAALDAVTAAAVAAHDAVSNVGTDFVLTTGVNVFTGGAGKDTFTADNTVSGQFSAADTLNGGAGDDSLTIFGTGGGTTVGKISNIEHITLDSMGAGGAWDLSSATGVSDVTVSRAAGAATVSVAAGVAVTLANNAAAGTIQTVNFSATQTSATLNLNGASGTTGVNTNVVGASLATLNLNTTGASSSIGTLGSAATIKTVNVTGDQNLTVVDALSANVTKVDATTFTGKLNVIAGAVADDGTTAVDLTIIGGTNNDTLSIVGVTDAAAKTVVNAGAGDDTVKVTAAQIAADALDTLNGGAGTDVLSVNFLDDNTGAGLIATDLSGTISGFESITLTSNNAAARTHTWAEGTAKTGITSFTINGDAADSWSITGLKAASTVKISSNANAVSAAIATDTTADTVNVTLDGTTLAGALTATNYETVNIASNKDSADNTNVLATVSATSAKTVNLTGSAALTGGTISLASGATFNAAAYTGDITATVFGTSVKSYVGGTGKDQITLLAGDLKQGNTFAGGAGTDKLTVTASASQDMGILGLTGFETVALTTSGANVADFRNVTDLASLTVSTGAATDDLTLSRLASTTQVTFHTAIDQVVTTINTGTSQKIGFDAAVAVASLTLDSGTTTLTVNSDNGNATADEAGGTLTAVSGTSLATINVTGLDRTNLSTLSATVTKVDASAATGGLTVTASGTATSIIGSQAADTITGGAGADTIEGGKGNDTISGGAGHDTIVFASTGALNGNDALTVTFGAGASSDVLNFKNFLVGGSVDQNAGSGTAIIAYSSAATTDVNIAGHVVTLADATGAGAITAVDTATEIAALIQGTGNVFSLTSGGKAIVIAGESTGTNTGSFIYFVDDSLDGVAGTVSAADVVLVGTLGANYDIDTILSTNVSFT